MSLNSKNPSIYASFARGGFVALSGLVLLSFLAIAPACAQPTRDAPALVGVDLKKVTLAYSLTNQDGVRVGPKDFPGKYQMIYFGYTMCPDMCPTGLQSMSMALEQLGPAAARVQPLFITVDPARDSAARLRDYLSAFYPGIMGLRGTDAETEAAANAFQVDYERVEDDEGADAEYVVEHNSRIYVFTPEGKLLKAFPENADPKRIVKVLHAAWNIRD